MPFCVLAFYDYVNASILRRRATILINKRGDGLSPSPRVADETSSRYLMMKTKPPPLTLTEPLPETQDVPAAS